MPAYFDTGFSVRQPMWHGEGTVLDDYPESWDEARLIAGLMWEPVEVPLYRAEGDAFAPVEGFKAVARDDTGEVLAVPSSGYQVITHGAMGEILDAVLAADGNVKFETAGSCRGGRQVWALAYLDEPFEIPGDDGPSYPFLSFLNSHDGTAACKLAYTSVRVVCWNTFQAASAEGDRSGAQFVFRHQGNVDERILAAKEALGGLRKDTEKYVAMMTALAQTPVNEDQVASFTQLFLPSPADHGEFVSDRVAANIDRARGTFRRLHDESLTTEAIRGTAYGLFQASTEYLDHVRVAQSRDTYMGRTLLRPEPLKIRALSLIGDLTGTEVLAGRN